MRLYQVRKNAPSSHIGVDCRARIVASKKVAYVSVRHRSNRSTQDSVRLYAKVRDDEKRWRPSVSKQINKLSFRRSLLLIPITTSTLSLLFTTTTITIFCSFPLTSTTHFSRTGILYTQYIRDSTFRSNPRCNGRLSNSPIIFIASNRIPNQTQSSSEKDQGAKRKK